MKSPVPALAFASVLALALAACAATAAAEPVPSCTRDDTVVGRCEHRRFGDRWMTIAMMPPLRLSLGASMRWFPVPTPRFATARTIDSSAATESDAANMSAITTDVRISVASRGLHAGLESQLALDRIGDEERRAGDLRLEIDRGLYVAAGTFAGVGVRLGPLLLGGEVLMGVRWLQLHLDVYQPSRRSSSTTSIWQPLVQPRVTAELQLSPWITAGVHAATDVLRDGDTAVGFFVELHVRAFDASLPR